MRQTARRLGTMVAATLLLAACAGAPKVGDWWNFTEADFRRFQAGATTQAEVLKQLGEPFTRSTFERQGEQVWEYRYMSGTFEMLAWVYFDRQGRYTYYSAQPDPARYSGTTR